VRNVRQVIQQAIHLVHSVLLDLTQAYRMPT
jgi:hypothetical protein